MMGNGLQIVLCCLCPFPVTESKLFGSLTPVLKVSAALSGYLVSSCGCRLHPHILALLLSFFTNDHHIIILYFKFMHLM